MGWSKALKIGGQFNLYFFATGYSPNLVTYISNCDVTNQNKNIRILTVIFEKFEKKKPNVKISEIGDNCISG